ncbi:MAG TPA: LysR family transcriptional regulator, partial [Symbiobacteriaceae bacterium]|nr:LysR family transcriptional regulator [Symbiobacteriaceae bacterium]
MDSRQLQTFLVVADLLHVTRAAERLGYAQSSVTAHVRALEEELGVPLFERLGKRITLTEAGRRFRPYALKLVALTEEGRSAAQEQHEVQGLLRIGAPESLCAYRLPAVLRSIRTRFPKVQLLLQTGICSQLRAGLRDGSIDLCLLLDECHPEPDLIQESLTPEPIILVAYPWHPLLVGRPVSPTDLRGQSVIHTEDGCSYRNRFEAILAAAGVTPESSMVFTSIEAIKQCVMAGLGLAVLPRIACTDELAEGALVELDWAGPPIDMETQVLYHRDKWRSPAMTAFLDVVSQTL